MHACKLEHFMHGHSCLRKLTCGSDEKGLLIAATVRAAGAAAGRLSTPRMAAKSDWLYAPAFLAAAVLWYLPMCLPLALAGCGLVADVSCMTTAGATFTEGKTVFRLAAGRGTFAAVADKAFSFFFLLPMLLLHVLLGSSVAVLGVATVTDKSEGSSGILRFFLLDLVCGTAGKVAAPTDFILARTRSYAAIPAVQSRALVIASIYTGGRPSL